MTMVNSYPERMNLSFSGCGFLCVYHAGVAAAIKEYAPHLIQNQISGASAGSIVAAGLLTGICISQATSTMLKIVTQARSRALGPLHPAFNLLGLVREEIVRTLPPDAYKTCSGRLQISLTRWSDKKNVVVSDYDCNQELIDAIICSCFIPVYCGLIPPKYRGVAYIDGGFTDNQPSYDDHTVTVSPFSGESDICPPDWDSASFFGISFSQTSIRFTTRNLFRLTACLMPPSTEDCSKMCLQGFEDALRFLTKNGMAPCIRCLTVQMNVEQPVPGVVTIPVEGSRGLSPLSGALGGRLRKRSCNINSGWKRLESECDTCAESDHMYSPEIRDVFPNILTKTFDEAFAAEDGVFKYLLSFRVFRWTRTALGVSKLPLDMMILFAKNLATWIRSVVAPDWLLAKLQALYDFVLTEVQYQKTRYTTFSCQLALTEIDSTRPVSVEKEVYNLELSDAARKELVMLKERDQKRASKTNAVSPAVKPKPTATVVNDWSWIGSGETDSIDYLVNYTHNHDAMYAFHYLDENNHVRGFELFNMEGQKKRHACHATTSIGSMTSSHSPRPVSMVIEEEECCSHGGEGPSGLQASTTGGSGVGRPSDLPDDADSGLSGVEHEIRKRDACCSPVRSFDVPSTSMDTAVKVKSPKLDDVVTGGGVGGKVSSSHGRTKSTRRHSSFGSSSQTSGRRQVHSGSLRETFRRKADELSTDSDADPSERLFVPARRQRTPSRGYDGEPEPSDNDK